MPSFLSSTNRNWSVNTGCLVPTSALLHFNTDPEMLKELFTWPTLETAQIDRTLFKLRDLKLITGDDRKGIVKFRSSTNVKPQDTVSFWKRSAIVKAHGPFAVTYHMMARDWVKTHKDNETESRKRRAAETPDEKMARRSRQANGSGPAE